MTDRTTWNFITETRPGDISLPSCLTASEAVREVWRSSCVFERNMSVFITIWREGEARKMWKTFNMEVFATQCCPKCHEPMSEGEITRMVAVCGHCSDSGEVKP